MDSGEEKRMAMYGEAYTFAEFVEYYKDGAQWYWDQAKPAEATPTEEPSVNGVSPPDTVESAASMQLISQTVTLRDLPHSLTVMVAQRLPVHPRQLFKVPARAPFDRSLTAELIAGSEYLHPDTGRSARAGTGDSAGLVRQVRSGPHPGHSG